jgi:hypothetical protein
MTTADEKFEEARENIKLAYKNILEALNPNTWGRDNYKELYVAQLHHCLIKLDEVKQILK